MARQQSAVLHRKVQNQKIFSLKRTRAKIQNWNPLLTKNRFKSSSSEDSGKNGRNQKSFSCNSATAGQSEETCRSVEHCRGTIWQSRAEGTAGVVKPPGVVSRCEESLLIVVRISWLAESGSGAVMPSRENRGFGVDQQANHDAISSEILLKNLNIVLHASSTGLTSAAKNRFGSFCAVAGQKPPSLSSLVAKRQLTDYQTVAAFPWQFPAK